jgi:hypothetical protein
VHLTVASRERCDARETPLILQDDPYLSVETGGWEALQRDRDLQLAELAAVDHTPVQPQDPSELAVLRNGERQLLGLHRGWYDVAGLLLTTDIYRINDRLRRGQDLNADPGVMLDWHGYTSLMAFVEDSNTMFDELGDATLLDEPIRVFRGIGVGAENEYDAFDFWGVRRQLGGDGDLVDSTVLDPGFMFAAPTESVARVYDGTDARTHNLQWKVLLELTITRALCIPSPEHRSKVLTRVLHPSTFSREATAQVVIPRDSVWTVTGFQPTGIDGWARLALTQAP